MGRHQELTKNVPWSSFGKETVASRVGHGLIPLGLMPFQPQPYSEDAPLAAPTPEQLEFFLMNIVGTGIQAEEGKLVTCRHVVNTLFTQESGPYMLGRVYRHETVRYVPYPLLMSFPYYDPRTDQPNYDVDLSIIPAPVVNTERYPYEAIPVTWGDSTQLGVGTPVIVGGYPYGTEMFLYTQSNRGMVQPTFHAGIISAVIPATASNETRLLQISVQSAGGMSGGAVFLPETGEVVGMITSCVHHGDIPLPISYALPSEIIHPFVQVFEYSTGP